MTQLERTWMEDPRFAQYVELFDRQQYFRAHEVLEELWLELSGDDREFVQGLIQLAVSLEHHKRDNPEGARKVLRSAGRRLHRYGASHRGIAIGELRDRIGAYLAGDADEPPRFPVIGRSGPDLSRS